MKSNRLLLPLICLLSLLCMLPSCSNPFSQQAENLEIDKDFKKINWEDDFLIMVPNYVDADRTLNEEADVAFSNLQKEVYIMVISEPKDFLDSVMVKGDLHEKGESLSESALYVHLTSLQATYEVRDVVEPKPLTISGLNAHTAEAVSTIDQVPIAYHITVVEGKAKIYTIWCWTLEKYRDKYRRTFEMVAGSFKLTK